MELSPGTLLQNMHHAPPDVTSQYRGTAREVRPSDGLVQPCALEITRCESIETTLRTRRLFFCGRGAVAKANNVWKPCGCSAERTERGGEKVDRLRTERRQGFGIAVDWKATALEAEVRVDTMTEGGRRFLAEWRK